MIFTESAHYADSVCVSVCLCASSDAGFFQGLSLPLRSHEQFPGLVLVNHPSPFSVPPSPCPTALFVDIFSGHFLWILFVDTFLETFVDTFWNIFCGHFLWTFFVDSFGGHFFGTIFVDTFCGNFFGSVFVDKFCEQFWWTVFWEIFL